MAAKIKRKKQEAELRELERQEELERIKFEKEKAALMSSGTEISIPCVESSFDDDDYFRDFGIGNVEAITNRQLVQEQYWQPRK